MFYWLKVTLQFFITLDFSQSLILFILGICIFLFALLSMIFSSGPPFYKLAISFYYISDDGSDDG